MSIVTSSVSSSTSSSSAVVASAFRRLPGDASRRGRDGVVGIVCRHRPLVVRVARVEPLARGSNHVQRRKIDLWFVLFTHVERSVPVAHELRRRKH